jgi:hypothetical protein
MVVGMANLGSDFDAGALRTSSQQQDTRGEWKHRAVITSRIGLTAAMKGCGTKTAT